MWDGLDCSVSVNCCAHPDMPWFSRYFTKAQETFIEARICRNEDTLVEMMELYIHTVTMKMHFSDFMKYFCKQFL